MSKTWEEIHEMETLGDVGLTKHQKNCMSIAHQCISDDGLGVMYLCDFDLDKANNIKKPSQIAEIIDSRFSEEVIARFAASDIFQSIRMADIFGGLFDD